MSCSGQHSHGTGGHCHDNGDSHDTSSDTGNGPLEQGLASMYEALDQVMNAESSDSLDMEWARAESLFHHIENEDSQFECEEHDVGKHCAEALATFIRCSKLIREEDLFPSSNETIEEVETENLKYMLVDYYIGKLQQMDTGNAPSPSRRLESIRLARLSLESFIDLVCRVGVVSDEERKSLGFSHLLEQARGREGPIDGSERPHTMDATAQRMAKIERFKRNSAAKKRLAQIAEISARDALRRRAAIKRGYIDPSVADGVGSYIGGGGGATDPEVRREQILLALETSAREAVDDIFAIDEETMILEHMVKNELQRPKPVDLRDPKMQPHGAGYEGKREMIGRMDFTGVPADDITRDPNRPGLKVTHINPSYEIKEETIKAGIFRPGWIPPNLTLEKWGEQVKEITEERDARMAEQAKDQIRSLQSLVEAGEEDNEKLWDIATKKEREFEDWKDGVPFGSGNTKRI